MKRKSFREDNIIALLKESEASAALVHICRRRGINSATIEGQRRTYGGTEAARSIWMSPPEALQVLTASLDSECGSQVGLGRST